jgi:hypothetical protein
VLTERKDPFITINYENKRSKWSNRQKENEKVNIDISNSIEYQFVEQFFSKNKDEVLISSLTLSFFFSFPND